MQLTLKTARLIKGLTQEEAGKMIGVSKDVISNWERCKTFPDALKIKKIEETYQVHYDQIIFLPSEYGKTVEGH